MKKATREQRNEQRAENLITTANRIDIFDKGTPFGKQNNYAIGCVFELWCAGINSAKVDMSSQVYADLLKVVDGGKRHGGIFSVVECKTQGADISAMFADYLNGKLTVDYVVYWLRKPYQKASERKKGVFNAPLYPVIVDATEFCENVGRLALRKDKSNGRVRGGFKDYAIEPNKPAWTAYLETRAIFSPLHKYTHTEIINGYADLSDADFDYIETLFNLFF